MRPSSSALPDGSNIAEAAVDADFADCYQLDDRWPRLTALETWLTLVARTPWWMNGLIALRNQTVRLAGLKHLGRFYMTIVEPVHQVIVPRMLAQVAHG